MFITFTCTIGFYSLIGRLYDAPIQQKEWNVTEKWKTSRPRISFGKLAEKEGQDYRTKRSRRTRKGRIARTRGERRRVRTRRKRRKTARKRKQA